MNSSFRLLTQADTIQVGDQFLDDDCETWWTVTDDHPSGRWMIGKSWVANFHVPARRPLLPIASMTSMPQSTEPTLQEYS